MLLLVTTNVFSENHKKLNWNDSQIKWYSYDEGMKQIKLTGKPGLLIIYADWCPTCKEYSTLFAQDGVVNSLANLILMRENKDTNPQVNNKYNLDGEYVPRTFALNNKGNVMQNFYSKDEKYTYFIPPNNSNFLIKFTKLIKQYGH